MWSGWLRVAMAEELAQELLGLLLPRYGARSGQNTGSPPAGGTFPVTEHFLRLDNILAISGSSSTTNMRGRDSNGFFI